MTIQEVPTVRFLLDQVRKCMKTMNMSFSPTHKYSWNEMLWSLVYLCGLKEVFPPSSLPITYTSGKVCGHMLNVELEDTTTHAMYLTMLEVSQDKDNALDSHIPALFIHCTALQNPIWDLGLQF